MKNEQIIEKLNLINSQSFPLEELDKELQRIKGKYVEENNQEQAKQIWIFQTIVELHKIYRNAFKLLKNKDYYEGWCQLERVEITIEILKEHFLFDRKQFDLWHIEKSVKNLQVIFPYGIFASSEILEKKKKCSVCDKEITIRNPCGHIEGEIYNGERCHRIITEAEVLGLALVENPVNKFSVMFLTDQKTGEKIDQYSYDAVDYLFECLESPYEYWDLEVSQRITKKEDFGTIGRNDPCACGSGKKFKKCCLKNIGAKYPHYEFILSNPSSKAVLTKTRKSINISS